MCTNTEWLLKHGITAIVDALDHPGPYTGATHVTKFRYKEELGLYKGTKNTYRTVSKH